MLLKVAGLEQWLPIVDHPGYDISTYGNVRSYRPLNGVGGFTKTPRPLKLSPGPKKEYIRAGLSNGAGSVQCFPVHTLMLLTFVGPRPTEYHDSCHNDGNAKNNLIGNLRWDTRQANADDRVRHGTQVRGTSVSLSKLTEEQVKEIKAAIPTWKKGMGKFFCEKFGIGASAVSSIKHNKTWVHV
jgi:HNH endonuclease